MGSIGIFDSGIGGLTVLKSIKKLVNNQSIYYIADQKNIPYSEKSEAFLKKRANKITNFLVKKGCSTIVIACNTSTVFTISHLRKKYKEIKFVGVEPAIKPASKTKNGNILVLATKNTIESKRLEELVHSHAKDKTIFYQDMSKWVLWAEKGIIDHPKVMKYSEEKLSKYKKSNISTVVLACTHYPYYTHIIRKIIKDASIINPSIAIARQTKKIHNETIVKNPSVKIYSTKSTKSLKIIPDILTFKVELKYASI